MLISSILSPLPSSNTNPSSQSEAPAIDEATETRPAAKSTPQTETSTGSQPSEKPDQVTSQSIVEANSKLREQSRDLTSKAAPDQISNGEAAARAAAEAYRAEAQQTAILERNASFVTKSQDSADMNEATSSSGPINRETGSEQAPLNKTV